MATGYHRRCKCQRLTDSSSCLYSREYHVMFVEIDDAASVKPRLKDKSVSGCTVDCNCFKLNCFAERYPQQTSSIVDSG